MGLEQGYRVAQRDQPDYYLLTDADIAHEPRSLRVLVAESDADELALNSRMARLHCESLAERLLIPAFVFFFNLLYPMGRVNDPRSGVAACAGGCVLVRAAALRTIGGFESIRGEVIDDVNLARAIGRADPRLRLAVSRSDVLSIRAYPAIGAIWRMVRRTAFDELGYSWLRLAATTAGMCILFLAPLATVLVSAALARRNRRMIDRLKTRIARSESEGGFTLIELLVVIIIIGILLAIAVPSYLGFRDRANNAAAQANVRSAIPAIEAFFADNDTYAGMTTAVLQASYDAGLSSSLSWGTLSASTYCVQSTVSTKTFIKDGPDADIVAGTC